MRAPKIIINTKYCQTPKNCLKCVQKCPPAVFNITFNDKDYHHPKNWFIDPVFPQLCLGIACSICIEVCPNNAISIDFKT